MANESNNRDEQLEDALHQEDEDAVVALGEKIFKWKQEIEALQLKLQEAKNEKKEIRKVSQQQLHAGSMVGIQHLENVSTLDTEIEDFPPLFHKFIIGCILSFLL